MAVRDSLNNHPAIITILAVVLLVGALWAILSQTRGSRSGPRDTQAYFYDLGSGKLFLDLSTSFPPIIAPSGSYMDKPGGVRAFIYSCGECDSDYSGMTVEELEEAGAYIAFIEKYTAQVQERLTKMSSQPGMLPMEQLDHLYREGMEIKEPGDDRWIKRFSAKGTQIQRRKHKCPSGEESNPCIPGGR